MKNLKKNIRNAITTLLIATSLSANAGSMQCMITAVTGDGSGITAVTGNGSGITAVTGDGTGITAVTGNGSGEKSVTYFKVCKEI